MAKHSHLLMVQGTSSGAGKSTIVLGLCRIFSDMGLRVAPFKSQNMSSNLFVTKDGHNIAHAQAVQAAAARQQPDSRMNPILLKPLGLQRSAVYLDGRLYSEMQAKDYYEKFALKVGLGSALAALESLAKENDIVVIEGAGSPAEINIAKYDIANMVLAHKVGAPVIIVADIERGGCFASIVGTMELLKPAHRKLVKGFVINKFRGDPALLDSGIKQVEKMTGRKIMGIVSYVDFNLPEEDSLTSRRSDIEIPTDSWDWQIDVIAKAIKDSINMDRIVEVAGL